MKDKLEKYMIENRESFDGREPRDQWERIVGHLPGRRQTIHWMWKAAAVIFFFSTVGLALRPLGENSTALTAEAVEANDFREVEQFYFSEISEKRNLIDELQRDEITDFDALAELQKLDAMYLVLRKQYEENPSPDVVDALTLNLLVRIDLLNRTLEILDSPGDLAI